jgi:hypothetical protein
MGSGEPRAFAVMAKRFAIIRNAETDRNVAILVHDNELGRVVFKCEDDVLQKAFDLWVDRPIIVHEPKTWGEARMTVRRKAVRFDKDYLDRLLDRFVKRPYAVRNIQESTSTIRLDNFADQQARETLKEDREL